jgi:hypothetical protein
VGPISSALHRFARIAIAIASLIFAVPLRSQDASTGAIRGTVLDPDNHPVAYATVAIVNTATGATRSAITDASGRFAVELLPPGDYSERAEIQGMSPQVTPQIHVDVGGSVEIQFRLSMAGTSETVTGYGRNAFLGPDYATTDLRLTRRLYLRPRMKLELVAEVFNALNRDNQRVTITDDGFTNTATDFIQLDKAIGIRYFPAYYQRPANLTRATSAYAPRQIQFALKFIF